MCKLLLTSYSTILILIIIYIACIHQKVAYSLEYAELGSENFQVTACMAPTSECILTYFVPHILWQEGNPHRFAVYPCSVHD